MHELNMEERLWEFIDGNNSEEEKSVIEQLLETNQQWREKYHELLELDKIMKTSSLDEPSLRFTKNVMEEIAKYHIAPATKTYINNKIVFGLGLFFITILVGFLIYGFGQIDWTSGGDSSLPFDVPKIDFTKFFNSTYMNVFMMINVILGLVLLDRYLASKKKKLQNEA
jgi:hypothetical protein